MAGNMDVRNILENLFSEDSEKDSKVEHVLKRTSEEGQYEVIEHISQKTSEENLRHYLRELCLDLLRPYSQQ